MSVQMLIKTKLNGEELNRAVFTAPYEVMLKVGRVMKAGQCVTENQVHLAF